MPPRQGLEKQVKSEVCSVRARFPIIDRPELVLGVLTLALHVWVNGSYGYFRDELYYIVCGRHPAFGYTDQPPLIPVIAWASEAAFHSLRGLRLVPALACAVTVALTAHAARMLGGGLYGRWLAGSRSSAAERWNSAASPCRPTACNRSRGWRSGSAS